MLFKQAYFLAVHSFISLVVITMLIYLPFLIRSWLLRGPAGFCHWREADSLPLFSDCPNNVIPPLVVAFSWEWMSCIVSLCKYMCSDSITSYSTHLFCLQAEHGGCHQAVHHLYRGVKTWIRFTWTVCTVWIPCGLISNNVLGNTKQFCFPY